MRRSEAANSNFLLAFLDDLRNLRANAILIMGVLAFGVMVAYHSDRMFGDSPRRGRAAARMQTQREDTKLRSDVLDLEQTMQDILQSHQGVSIAAETARKAVEEQHAVTTQYQATLVLSFQSESSNLHLAMRAGAARAFVKEILLWHTLTDSSDALDDAPSDMYGTPVVYVTTNQRRDVDKYQACANHAAETSNVCIIQSVSRDTSGYMAALFASFLRAPPLLHVAAGPLTFYSDSQLRLQGEGIHAAFASTTAGAIFLREHARRFIQRVDAMRDTKRWDDELDAAWEGAADVPFSLWLNAPVVELSVDMTLYKRQLDEVKVVERDAFAKRNLHKGVYLRALKELQTRLYRQEQTEGPPPPSDPTPASDAVSACKGDGCLLITNSQLLDPIKGSMQTITDRVTALLEREQPPPAAELYKAHQYHYAVDGDPATQWRSTRNASVDSYYGLDLLRLHKDIRNVTVLTAHPFQEDMVLEVSMRGNTWYPVASLPIATLKDAWHGFAVSKYVYDLSEALASAWQRVLELPEKHHKTAPTPPLYIRYLRFRALKPYANPFIVFDISYGVGEAMDGIPSALSSPSSSLSSSPSSYSPYEQRAEEEEEEEEGKKRRSEREEDEDKVAGRQEQRVQRKMQRLQAETA